MNSFRFQNSTVLYFGRDQLEKNLIKEVNTYGKRVLFVYGGGSIKQFGLYETVVHLLTGAGIEVFELSGVEPNPRLSTVHRGIEICKEKNIDLVLAAGGGSVLDCGKAIAMGVKFDGDVWNIYARKAESTGGLPIGTILTLAATGSEMNGSSVITNWETKEKLGITSRDAYPKFSFCNPEYTFTVPRNPTIYGIGDMFAHCLEHYFHPTTNTPLQQHMIEAVMRTIVETGPVAVNEPTNYEARETIMFCGTMALNQVISMGIAGDWACHKIEHELSAIYDIPHGGGLAILFPYWMDHVLSWNPERFAALAQRVFDVPADGKEVKELAVAGIAKTRAFFASINAPTRLSDFNIDDKYLVKMARQAVRFGPLGQYKKLEFDDVLDILHRAL